MSANLTIYLWLQKSHDGYNRMKADMDMLRQPAEPKSEIVECAIVEMLELAQRQGITPGDFIQLLDAGMPISDFLAAMTLLANANHGIDCDS
ncbi:MAG TPA: hypothetical protein VKQ11_07440 [Candidatus Sulfotelmatobacter sp.]|nr:hypothetical protein [Candidatus Sulfotelmatobacter sp.]